VTSTASYSAQQRGLSQQRPPRRTLVIGGGIGEAIAQASPPPVVLASRVKPRRDGDLTHFPLDDLADPKATQKAIDAAVTQLGGVDVLAVCAGTRLRRGHLLEHSDQEWIDSYRENVVPVVRACRGAAPVLAASPHAVLVIVITAHDPFPNPQVAPYSAAEAALDALTRTLAVDLAPQGIRVFAVAPTTSATERAAHRIRRTVTTSTPRSTAARLSIVGGESARLTIQQASTRIPVVYFRHSATTAQRILELVDDPTAHAATYLIDTEQ
jgi:NAD(P)-dependent dehydrogenase (short-subunit alcohol dehydrogenase family)